MPTGDLWADCLHRLSAIDNPQLIHYGSYETQFLKRMRAVIQARDWYKRIVSGKVRTIRQLAKQSGFSRSYVKRILRCARLSPKVSDALLEGKHPNVTLKTLLYNVSLDWREQEKSILRTRSI